MSVPFNPREGLIVVRVELMGPTGAAILRLALDTGATGTLVDTSMLVAIGYDLALAPESIEMTTGSGIEFVPRITVSSISALNHIQKEFPVLGHTLPPSAGVDGLLGLDFVRDQVLSIDFQNGLITLEGLA
jgi:aspartyl protease family protein